MQRLPKDCVEFAIRIECFVRGARKIVERVQNTISKYLEERWLLLNDHPLIGEARIKGMMGALELTPEKSKRSPFLLPEGEAGMITREICIKNGLIMRAVGDKMII